jgi:hypothetical protein
LPINLHKYREATASSDGAVATSEASLEVTGGLGIGFRVRDWDRVRDRDRAKAREGFGIR